jgi:CrcB protein
MRHGVNNAVLMILPGGFPAGIIAVNILGSGLMGILAGVFTHFYDPSQTVKLFLTTGVLGGFTTFSAFSLDVVMLWERGQVMQAALYVCISVFLSVTALAAGLLLVRSLAA